MIVNARSRVTMTVARRRWICSVLSLKKRRSIDSVRVLQNLLNLQANASFPALSPIFNFEVFPMLDVFLIFTPSTVQPSNPLMSLRILASFTTVSFDNDHNVYARIGRCERNARSACSKAGHIGSTTRCIAYSERRRLSYWWKRWLVLWVGLLRRCCGCLCGCRTLRGGLGGDEAW